MDYDQYREMHATMSSYGDSGSGYERDIRSYATINRCSTLVDWGCGKGKLVGLLNRGRIRATGYDPYVRRFERMPLGVFDLVISTDFFEHLFEEDIIDTIGEMLYYEPKAMWHIINMSPAKVILPDGTNPHKSLLSIEAWEDLFTHAATGWITNARWHVEKLLITAVKA